MLMRTRVGGAAVLAVAGALALSACGSDNNGGGSSGGTSAGSSSSSSSSSSGSSAGGISCASGSLTASGSTAQTNAISAWTKAYQQACSGANINYGGGGSGAGVTQFSAGSVAFAGSDYPLSAAQKPAADKACGTGNQAIDLPMVPGPIAVSYNLPGVSSLNLSASTLAGIFSNKITKWNDAAITKDNPGVSLPSAAIQTFHRSDSSGTTFNFTNYLQNDAKSAWTYSHDKAWKAPGGQGAKGSSAVAQKVKTTQGGIGYFEQSYATQSNLSIAKIGNADGKFVELTSANTVKFLSTAKVTGTGGDLALTFDYTNADPTAYPNVLVTYEIVCAKGTKAASLPLLKSFLTYTAGSGQSILGDNGYVTLPTSIDTQVKAAVAALG